MFELYFRANADNTRNTVITCEIEQKDNNYIVELQQIERNDDNIWNKAKVQTDMIVTQYVLPELYSHISSKSQLKKYIMDNFDESLELLNTLDKMSQSKQRTRISLPTSRFFYRRGLPTSSRPAVDTPYPLIVEIEGKDVSWNFIDFGDFEENAVQAAYNALFKDIYPRPKTHEELFYKDGVKSLHQELVASGMAQ